MEVSTGRQEITLIDQINDALPYLFTFRRVKEIHEVRPSVKS